MTRSCGKDSQEEDVTLWASRDRSSKSSETTGRLFQTDSPGPRGSRSSLLFLTVPEKQTVVMEWASVEVHSWWLPTLVGGRFPRHRFGGQIIWGRIRRMSCSLCFAMLPRIPQTPQLWPYVPEPWVGSRRAGNMGSHMSPAPRASCQAFLVIGNSLQALKEVWKLVASSPDLLKR